ncbi:MAG: hypothetical protein ACO3LT_06630 [Ilumatobacteraceae bacterium]
MKKLIIASSIVAVIGAAAVLAQNPIPAKEPIVVPAVAEKTYSSYWVRNLSVRATSPTDGTFYVELLPYDPATGEIDQSRPKELRGDLWALIGAKPEAGAAMQAVFTAVPKIEAFVDETAAAAAAAAAAQPEE